MSQEAINHPCVICLEKGHREHECPIKKRSNKIWPKFKDAKAYLKFK